MKAISLHQPWAHLMAIGLKKNETRHWTTKHRGEIAIHAAKRKMDADAFNLCRNLNINLNTAAFGALVAIVSIEEIVPTEVEIPCLEDTNERGETEWHQEYFFGNYGPNRFAWKTSNVRRLSPPIPYLGRQGIFNVPDELITNALYASDL